jgi:hypothetical protein
MIIILGWPQRYIELVYRISILKQAPTMMIKADRKAEDVGKSVLPKQLHQRGQEKK